MRVLVTGGTGFVGSHAAAALVRAGHDVRLLARRPEQVPVTFAPHGVETGDVVRGDVLDEQAVAGAVRGCDAVVHAAAVFSLDRRDAAKLQEVAHTLKGSAGNFGAREAVEGSSRLEGIGRRRDWDQAEVAWAALEEAIGRLGPALAGIGREGMS